MACYTHKQIQDFARQAGFPDVLYDGTDGKKPLYAYISAISTQESGRCDSATGTVAKGKERSIGIMQINTFAHKNYSESELRNPLINMKEAYRISNGGKSFRAWGAYVTGAAYKKYMPQAMAAYSGKAETNTNNSVATNNNIVSNLITDIKSDTTTKLAAYGVAGLLVLALLKRSGKL